MSLSLLPKKSNCCKLPFFSFFDFFSPPSAFSFDPKFAQLADREGLPSRELEELKKCWREAKNVFNGRYFIFFLFYKKTYLFILATLSALLKGWNEAFSSLLEYSVFFFDSFWSFRISLLHSSHFQTNLTPGFI